MNKSGSDSSNHTALYHGMSMKRVFVPGERLFLRQIAPEALVCGDVVAITYPERGKDVVHRVIRIGNGELQTMGDNNATPDDVVKFTENRHFYLVTGAEDLHGRYREVINGAAGMRLFYRNQRRRRMRRLLSRIIWFFEPCFFWRKTVSDLHTFDSDEVFYYKNNPVIRRYSDGKTVYLKWYYRFLYKVK